MKPANVLLDVGRPRVPDRLRDHEAARRRLHRHRPARRDARLPGARADPRRTRRRAHGQLRARVRALRMSRRQASIPARNRGRDHVGSHAGRAAGASWPRAARRGASQGAREGQGGPLRELLRADRGRRRRARPPDARGGTPPAGPERAPPACARDPGGGLARARHCGCADDRRGDGRRRRRCGVARQRDSRHRSGEWRRRLVRRLGDAAGQRRGRRRGSMGAQQRARDRLANRPADEASHEAVQDAGRANRPGRRRRSALGRAGGGRGHYECHGQRLASRSRDRPYNAYRPPARRPGEPPCRGCAQDRRGGRRRVGCEPGRQCLPHRPGQRSAGGDDRDRGRSLDHRCGRRGGLVL